MKYTFKDSTSAVTNNHDCIVIPVFSKKNKAVLAGSSKQVDEASHLAITQLIEMGDFTGKSGQLQMLYKLEGISSQRVLVVGCGDKDKFDNIAINKVTKSVCKSIKDSNIGTLSLYLAESFSKEATAQATMQIVLAHADSAYQLNDYKSTDEDENKDDKIKNTLKEVCIAFTDKTQADAQTAVSNASAITEGMKISRDLANHPGNVCTPTFMATTAKSVADNYANVSIEVLEETDMEKLGMGAFLSVSKGSDEPGKMIVLEYHGAKDKSQAPVALVGKGVTFDTGGISLKPGANMDEMKFDMCGAASMLGTLKACAEMKLPINLVVVLAAAENMPSARASKPGDIVTSMAGKTIEVLNTDAEGRLVLCDALTYVGKYKPQLVIDTATLTGACIVALGHHICAVLSNDDELASDIIDAGNTINDRAWQLPMGDDYKKQLKSSFADLGNIGGRGAGTITAACFLAEFTKEYKWAHIDIAGTAWDGKDATGRPVPLLSQFLINHVNK